MAIVTWDASNKGANVVLTNNNLTASGVNSNNGVRATLGRLAGKWYWEIEMVVVSYARIGIVSSDNLNKRLYDCEAKKQPENTAYGSTYAVGNIIGIALDLDNGLLEFYKNGVSQGISHTNIKALGEVFPYMTTGYSSAGSTTIANFGATPFKYPMPKGYYSYDNNQGWSNKFLISSGGEKLSIKKNDTWDTIKMTSNNTPSPLTVSASSTYSASYPAWGAFDANESTTFWATAYGVGGKGWITIDYGQNKKVNRARLTVPSGGDSTAFPKDFNILGSQDGTNFVVIVELRNQIITSASEIKEYNFDDSSYRYYRIESISNNGNTNGHVAIANILFGYLTIEVKLIPSQTEQNFTNHGMDKPIELDLSSKISTRAFIEQSPTTLGSGKVFKKSIDTSQVPIKKVTIK